jgi:hypothetical protein
LWLCGESSFYLFNHVDSLLADQISLASITTAWGWKQIAMVYLPGLQNPISAERWA